MSLPALWPGIVRSVDRNTRLCRVEIPGITDGTGVLPEAEIKQPLGDRSEDTEIRILPGDRVWLQFIGGDPRYPIIDSFRARNAANMVGTRHWEHENIDLQADQDFNLEAGATITQTAGETILLGAGTSITLVAGGSQLVISAAGIAALAQLLAQEGLAVTGTATANGANIGSDHTHTEQGDGAETSGPH